MIKARLLGQRGNESIHTGKPFAGFTNVSVKDELLITTPFIAAHGVFKASTLASQGTTIITSPVLGGSILLTDLIMTTDKTNATSVTVSFTDGSQTIDVAVGDSTNAPVNLALSFAGRWQGWKDARLEMTTVGAVTATVAVGYVKLPNGLSFAEWDAFR